MSISRDSKSGDWKADKKKSGPPTWERILFPISNLASLKRGGKVKSTKRKSTKRKATRSER